MDMYERIGAKALMPLGRVRHGQERQPDPLARRGPIESRRPASERGTRHQGGTDLWN